MKILIFIGAVLLFIKALVNLITGIRTHDAYCLVLAIIDWSIAKGLLEGVSE